MARLIIVEDNHELAALIAAAVRGRGHSATAAHTGQAALELLDLQGFDLAVVDLLLPDMAGSRVLYELGKRGIPGIVMSGVFKGNRFLNEAIDVHGAKAFFEKPFEMKALLDEIDRLVGAPPRTDVADIEDDEVLEELSPIEDEHGSFILPAPSRPPVMPPPPPPDAHEPDEEEASPGGYPKDEEQTKPPLEPDEMELTRKIDLPASDFVGTFAGAQAVGGAAPGSENAPGSAADKRVKQWPEDFAPEVTEPNGQVLVLTEDDKERLGVSQQPAGAQPPPFVHGELLEGPGSEGSSADAAPTPWAGTRVAEALAKAGALPPSWKPEVPTAAPASPAGVEPNASARPTPPAGISAARSPVPVLPSLDEAQAALDGAFPAAPPRPTTPGEEDPVLPFGQRGKVWSTPEKKAEPAAPSAASGALEGTAVPRLLTAYYQARHTGELKLRQGNVVKLIYFDKGQPIYAASNLAQERFGRFCLRQSVLTPEQLEEVARTAKEQNLRTADAMIKRGLLTPERRRELVGQQVREIIWSTFNWHQGDYTFVPKRPPSAGLVKLSVFPGNLIMQGVQRTETLVSLRQKVPPKRRYVPTQDPPYELHQINLTGAQALLLAYSDGSKTVEDLLSLSDLPEKEALGTLVGFELLGLLTERREESRSARITFGL